MTDLVTTLRIELTRLDREMEMLSGIDVQAELEAGTIEMSDVRRWHDEVCRRRGDVAAMLQEHEADEETEH